jgi:hypothetical protein
MELVKNRNITILGIFVLFIIISIGLLVISQINFQVAAKSKEPPRPVTIENVVLRIESNIMRIQAAMEQLVFSEYAPDLAKSVDAINRLNTATQKDFKAMGEHFQKNNIQYLKALTLFNEWKTIREEIINLTANGPSVSAKKIVRGKSASQAMEIRTALKELNDFSKKRADKYDSTISRSN